MTAEIQNSGRIKSGWVEYYDSVYQDDLIFRNSIFEEQYTVCMNVISEDRNTIEMYLNSKQIGFKSAQYIKKNCYRSKYR